MPEHDFYYKCRWSPMASLHLHPQKALAGLRFAGGQTVCPTELIRAISQLSPSLTSGQQQEAAEALEVMLSPNPIQEPFSAQIQGEVTDVITCVTCNSESVMKRPLSPPILRVPIMARSMERCLIDLMKPQPIDGSNSDPRDASGYGHPGPPLSAWLWGY